jgi:hypothetical protein
VSGGHCKRCERTATRPSDSWTEHPHWTTEGNLCCLHFEEHVRELFKFPETIPGSIRRWVDDRILPGGFLTSVLRNLPVSVVVRLADDHNARILPKIVSYLINYAPDECWGSAEKVERWKTHPNPQPGGKA